MDKAKLQEELSVAYKEQSEDFPFYWDAVTPAHYSAAIRFVEMLPDDLPQPEVHAEPDGCLGLEWCKGYNVTVDKDKTYDYYFSFSINPDDTTMWFYKNKEKFRSYISGTLKTKDGITEEIKSNILDANG